MRTNVKKNDAKWVEDVIRRREAIEAAEVPGFTPRLDELVELVHFWLESYMTVHSEKFVHDEPIRDGYETMICVRLEQIRKAIGDGEFVQALDLACVRFRLESDFHQGAVMNDRVWRIFLRGNNAQRRTATLVVEKYPDPKDRATRDELLAEIYNRPRRK